ncbi:MAG: hypothetical protein ACPGVB_04615 [Chitinophagales bacterium]
MDINNHNYEEFAIDYLEGNLSPKMEEAMQIFLLQNPAIEAELMSLEEVILEADTSIVFLDKEALLQSEESAKVVPLYASISQKWKRYVLPIAAALCLFFVWQMLLQTGLEEKNDSGQNGEIVVANGADKELKGESIADLGEVEQEVEVEEEGIEGIEDEKETNSEMKYNLKKKKRKHNSFIADSNPSTENSSITSTESKQKIEKKQTTRVETNSKIAAKTATLNSDVIVEREHFIEDSRGEFVFSERNENAAKTEGNRRKVKEEIAANTNKMLTKSIEIESKRKNENVIALAVLPQQTPTNIIQQSIVATNMKFRELPQTAIPSMEIEGKKQKSTFLNNLKKAITPEIFAGDEMEESSTGSEVLVSISLKPNQHDFIKKIFKNNK